MNTEYASAERSDKNTLLKQKALFQDNKLVKVITNAVSSALVILNENRQIIYMNDLFSQITNRKQIDEIIGLRAGEALECIHSYRSEGGCGTTEFCKKCGAVNSILEAQKGWKNVSECSITSKRDVTFDLEVTSSPFDYNEEKFIIFTVKDISDRNRRNILERVFFHDVLNSAGGISGLSEVLTETDNIEEYHNFAKIIHNNAELLINEISSHRQLLSAEKGELQTDFKSYSSEEILNQIIELYSNHQISKDNKIIISSHSETFQFKTDSTLLNRVVGNMTKNAIEASNPNSEITLKAELKQNKPTFSVHNQSYISYESQLQIFKRSFSTKGSGRGIGTYSMKLLGEKYLRGKVWFETNLKQGTTFYIQLPASD